MSNVVLHRSERLYRLLLNLYPKQYRQEFGKEMLYVFSEQLSESYQLYGESGLITIWIRTITDTVRSSISQHLDHYTERKHMPAKNKDFISDNRVFGVVALITTAILMIPFVGMQLSNEVDWSLSDFLIIGALLFGAGSLFVLAARHIRTTTQRVIVGLGFLFVVLWLWAELAVGIFTNWGS